MFRKIKEGYCSITKPAKTIRMVPLIGLRVTRKDNTDGNKIQNYSDPFGISGNASGFSRYPHVFWE